MGKLLYHFLPSSFVVPFCVFLLCSLSCFPPFFLLRHPCFSCTPFYLYLFFVFCLLSPLLLCSPFPFHSFFPSFHFPTRHNPFLKLNNHNHCYTYTYTTRERERGLHPLTLHTIRLSVPSLTAANLTLIDPYRFHGWCFPHCYAIRLWGQEGAMLYRVL